MHNAPKTHPMDLEVPYFSNLNANPMHLGLEALLMTSPEHVSSQRSMMVATHVQQALTVHGNEFPRVFTGFENIIGDYEHNTSKRDQSYDIIHVLEKFRRFGMHPVNYNPSRTVIIRDHETGRVSYFELSKYTCLTDGGYGYLNVPKNEHMLANDWPVEAGTEFYNSPIKRGNRYCLGTNLNIAYMTLQGTTEDAIIISESVAKKKLKTTHIETISIRISKDQIPLNLYGDSTDNYKFIPDVGECVNDDGILAAFRTPTEYSIIADTTPEALSKIQHLHDSTIMAPPGAQIVDINVYLNYDNKKLRNPGMEFAQAKKYADLAQIYYEQIVKIYTDLKEKGYTFSPEFNTLVHRAMAFRRAANFSVPGLVGSREKVTLVNKKDPIEFIQIDITFATPRDLALGFKLTGREGHKGVVCQILKDEDMPTDDYGFRADIVMCPAAIFNRMNPSQLYEQFINRCSEFVRRQICSIVDSYGIDAGFNYLVEYLEKINANYAQLIVNNHSTIEERVDLIEGVRSEGIYVNVLPFLKTMTPELVLKLAKEYDVKISPVTYTLRDDDGNIIKRVRTKASIMIGEKYIYHLYKIPHLFAPGVGYINQYRTPVKPNSLAKNSSPYARTPLRFGEDEIRNMIMTVGPEVAARMLCLYGNSPEATKILNQTLLTVKHPTQIEEVDVTTDFAVKTNAMCGVQQHMLGTVGVEPVVVNGDKICRVASSD